jgi:hypothetical protein
LKSFPGAFMNCLFSYSISHFLVCVFILRSTHRFLVNRAKIYVEGIMATKVVATNSGKLGGKSSGKVETLRKQVFDAIC